MMTDDGDRGSKGRGADRAEGTGGGARGRDVSDARAAREPPLGELGAMVRLHAIATRFVREGDLAALLAEIVEAAVAIAGADMGYIQVLDASSNELEIIAHRGFDGSFLAQFARRPVGL